MCGFAGICRLKGEPFHSDTDLQRLELMGQAIGYRGPDQTCSIFSDNTGIVFNRLSIVDIKGGQQPFETSDGRIQTVVNGEIYNHQELRKQFDRELFHSESDCEIIPHLYQKQGLRMLDQVNGMFAIALLDLQNKRLILARDRMGIKPLFYCLLQHENLFLFASELKALLAHPLVPRKFDWVEALARDQLIDARGRELPSYFKGIEKLPSAHLLQLSLETGEINQNSYWSLSDISPEEPGRPVGSYVEEYRQLLKDSVRLRLMGEADFGVFLSGGIDSGAIASIAADQHDFPTFSIRSQSTLGNEEIEVGSKVAASLGLTNHQLHFDCLDTGIQAGDWRRILWHCELFEINAEQIYKFYLHQFARETYPELKIILLGQGSDEFNGGYTKTILGHRDHWDDRAWELLGKKLNQRLIKSSAIELGILSQYHKEIRQDIFKSSFIMEESHIEQQNVWNIYRNFCRQNLDHHLWHEDRTAAAHSIENRVPFLDHHLLEHLARVPESYQAALFTDKKILRKAMSGIVPELLLDRPKTGLFYGQAQHFTYQMMFDILDRNNEELIEQALSGSDQTGGPFNPNAFRKYVASVKSDPSTKQCMKLLKLVNMGLLADMALSPPTFAEETMPAAIQEFQAE